MKPVIVVEEIESGHAAVKRGRLAMRDIPRGIMPLFASAWEVVRAGGVPGYGHGVWIYHHREDGDVDVEVGVMVSAPFADRDGLVGTRIPGGRVAHVIHHGDYSALPGVHSAILNWCSENGLTRTGDNWEVYGDMHEDVAKNRCDVYHLLR